MSDLVVMQGGKEHSNERAKIIDLRNKVEESYWELSKELSNVYQGSYYIAWGFASWNRCWPKCLRKPTISGWIL